MEFVEFSVSVVVLETVPAPAKLLIVTSAPPATLPVTVTLLLAEMLIDFAEAKAPVMVAMSLSLIAIVAGTLELPTLPKLPSVVWKLSCVMLAPLPSVSVAVLPEIVQPEIEPDRPLPSVIV